MNTQHRSSAVSEREFIFLVAFLMSIVAFSIDALLPALGYISTDLSILNPNHVQYLIGFIFVGISLGQLVSGPCSDAMGRKKVLYIGIAIFMVGSVICYFAATLTVLLCGRFVQGIGVAGPYVSAISIVRDKYSGREMAKIMSLVMMIFIMVPALAPSVGQAVLFFSSWRGIFVLYIIYSFGIGAWLYFRLEETLPVANRIPLRFSSMVGGFREVTRNPATMMYTLCMGICFGSFIGYLNSSQQIFQIQFEVGKLFTVYFGLLALILGIASLMNSHFVEKYGMHYICVRSFLCIVCSSIVFLAAHFVTEIHLWMFLLYAAVLFFSFGLIFGNLNALAMEPMGHIAGIASAIIGCVSSALSMVIGAIIGQLYDNTLIPIVGGFLLLGAVSLFCLVVANRFRNTKFMH